MKVVVNVAQVFLGKGSNAARFRRGAIVEVEGKEVPAWGLALKDAVELEKKKAKPKAEPRTMSEMNKEIGPAKAFGQEI